MVLAVEFHPTDANTIVTCGKFHIFFWTWNGNSLLRKQGLFGVRGTVLLTLAGFCCTVDFISSRFCDV